MHGRRGHRRIGHLVERKTRGDPLGEAFFDMSQVAICSVALLRALTKPQRGLSHDMAPRYFKLFFIFCFSSSNCFMMF